jgi:hypothetical protein
MPVPVHAPAHVGVFVRVCVQIRVHFYKTAGPGSLCQRLFQTRHGTLLFIHKQRLSIDFALL